MTNRLRIGLIGCGDFGKYLGPYIQEVAEITALCDPSEDGMVATAEALNLEVTHYSDHEEMLQSGDLDAVAITAANYVHRDLTVAAANRGLHVYCEKAMARTVPECWEMARACQANDVKLMVGHKRRLRSPWARMIELTDDSMLGRPLAITVAEYCDNRPYDFFDTWWADPELGGGFFHLHGVHVIDWFRAMCGDAKKVTAIYGPQHDDRYKFHDIVHATFQFESGALASINGGSAIRYTSSGSLRVPGSSVRMAASSWFPRWTTSTCSGNGWTKGRCTMSDSTTWDSITPTVWRSVTSSGG